MGADLVFFLTKMCIFKGRGCTFKMVISLQGEEVDGCGRFNPAVRKSMQEGWGSVKVWYGG